jgi:hypothetical protein
MPETNYRKTNTSVMKKQMILWVLPLCVIGQQCAPVFSDMQGARMVGKGNKEVTPFFTSTGAKIEGDAGRLQNHLGTHLSFGLAERWEMRTRLEYTWNAIDFGDDDGEPVGLLVLGAGPKVSLLKDRIAASLPAMLALSGEGVFLQSLQPTLLFTVPVIRDIVDFNSSVKYVLMPLDGVWGMPAVNVGLSIGNPKGITLRTEYGWMFYTVEAGHYNQFSVGLGLPLNRKKKM